ncbi:MAG: NUDIX domain-containing protein [Patescibacteria group bacterium]|nr:NUDIX domain-containing protein [Patescibacteria group bacterium]
MPKISAGLLMYRMVNGEPEILLVHPGGPFWKNKDIGVWSIPKGETEEGEEMLEVAKREFKEETGVTAEGDFVSIGSADRPGKTVHAWMFEGDCDPTKIISNMITIEWPPKSGKKIDIPEVDRAGFFSVEEARSKIVGYQLPLIDEFVKKSH